MAASIARPRRRGPDLAAVSLQHLAVKRQDAAVDRAWPAIGVRQEPSSTQKGALGRERQPVAASMIGASNARVAASLARAVMPIAPWPTAGSISSSGNRRSPRPRDRGA